MGEFRIGRKFAQHSYPEAPRGAGPSGFARNSAFGPQGLTPQALGATGDKIKWDTIESGGVSGDTAVKITPKVTGIVRALINVVVENTAGSTNNMIVEPFLDGSSIGAATISTVDAAFEGNNGFITIPFELDFAGAQKLSVGVTHTIEVKVIPQQGGTSTGVLALSSIDLQELPAATG